jgi:hypothetical protein
MTSTDNGDSSTPPTLWERMSQSLIGGGTARGRPGQPGREPGQILEGAERRAAMSGLDPNELKWSKGGLTLAALIGAILVIYLAVEHPTRKLTQKVHGHEVTRLVPVSDTYLLIGAIVVGFCILGFEGVRRRKRTLVAFSLFIDGFAFTLVFAPLGFALILLGGWLMLRAWRIQKYGTANAKAVARQAATRPPRRERTRAARTPPPPTGHVPPKANKRYTPKAPPRRKIPKSSE